MEDLIMLIVLLLIAMITYFMYKMAKHTKTIAQNSFRPILIIEPDENTINDVTRPKITVRNYGNGPAVVSEVNYFGLSKDLKALLPTRTNHYLIIPTGEAKAFTPDHLEGVFGTQPGVTYEVKYSDIQGNDYRHSIEYRGGRWVRSDKNVS